MTENRAETKWQFSGDVNLEYGGTFVDLSDWEHGYASAVRVTDLDSAIGFRGACLIEHATVCGVDDPRRIRKALESCGGCDTFERETDEYLAFLEAAHADKGGAAADMLADWIAEADRRSLFHYIAEALLSYGFYDIDDVRSETVQMEQNGPMRFDGWKATKRLKGTTLEAYVKAVHLDD